MILTKIDLLPYVPFDRDRCLDYARQVNPHIQIFQVSAMSGEGLSDWYEWLRSQFLIEATSGSFSYRHGTLNSSFKHPFLSANPNHLTGG